MTLRAALNQSSVEVTQAYLAHQAVQGRLIQNSPTAREIVLYRNELVPALKRYFKDYRGRLLRNENDAQKYFLTKFDHLSTPLQPTAKNSPAH